LQPFLNKTQLCYGKNVYLYYYKWDFFTTFVNHFIKTKNSIMSFNLLDVVKSHLNSDVISQAASFLGESESGVSKAMGGILPTVLSGLASKSSSSTGAQEVADMAGDAHNSGILGNIGNFFGGGSMLSKGADLVKGLFGGKLGGIVDVISGLGGLKSGSTSSLLSMALPVVLGSLGKHSADNNLGASGIASLLSSGKSSWASLLPGGLGNLLGGAGAAVSSIAGGAKDVAGNVANYADDAVGAAKGGVKWLLPLLLLAALGFLAWYLLGKNGCGKKDEVTTPVAAKDTSTVNPPPPPPGTATMPTKESLKVKLADGTEIDAFKGGIEDRLVTLLNDKANTLADSADKSKYWFDFDNLNFDFNKTTITKESQVQLKNIMAIMKAYPALKFKIGAYTDKKGDDAGNMKLSQSRADAVLAALKAGGVNMAQITKAEGYGESMATVAETGTDEERLKDRRTSIRVLAK
jgi:outer membrane protein OmpA-like peptidoglycan-associated protein